MLKTSDLTQNDVNVLDAIFNPFQVPQDPNVTEGIKEVDKEDLSVQVDLCGLSAADAGNYNAALEVYTKAISITPERAALYNNRAQIYRLLENDCAAMTDLTKAIELSNSKGQTGMQALCQRGLLHRKNDKSDAAKADFEAAANLGSKFAKAQLVELNPYAALCNQMLREVFAKQGGAAAMHKKN